jgi:hypothetical protein
MTFKIPVYVFMSSGELLKSPLTWYNIPSNDKEVILG